MKTHPDVSSLLAAHGLAGADEHPFDHEGFSGATLTRLTRDDGSAFVLKRMTIERDWIMRATDDATCREAIFAGAAPNLGPRIRSPAVGVARDGDAHAMLMRDITPDLLPQGTIQRHELEAIIAGMVALHRQPVPAAPIPWCSLEHRLMLLTPANVPLALSYGARVANDLVAGWPLFDRHATASARDLIHGLFADVSPLLRALDQLPRAFLHGDLKFDNIGLSPEGDIWLIDWAITLTGPPAVELGWFLAINSRRITVSLDEVMDLYAAAAGIPPEQRERHHGLTVLCGLVLRGWRKGLDAEEGQPEELAWWCARSEAAARLL